MANTKSTVRHAKWRARIAEDFLRQADALAYRENWNHMVLYNRPGNSGVCYRRGK